MRWKTEAGELWRSLNTERNRRRRPHLGSYHGAQTACSFLVSMSAAALARATCTTPSAPKCAFTLSHSPARRGRDTRRFFCPSLRQSTVHRTRSSSPDGEQPRKLHFVVIGVVRMVSRLFVHPVELLPRDVTRVDTPLSRKLLPVVRGVRMLVATTSSFGAPPSSKTFAVSSSLSACA